MAEDFVKAPKNELSLGFDNQQHEALLIHPHKMEKLVSGVCPEPLLGPMVQNMFHQLGTRLMQQQPKLNLLF